MRHCRNKVLEAPFKVYGKGQILRGEKGNSSGCDENNRQKQRKTYRDIASNMKNNFKYMCLERKSLQYTKWRTNLNQKLDVTSDQSMSNNCCIKHVV